MKLWNALRRLPGLRAGSSPTRVAKVALAETLYRTGLTRLGLTLLARLDRKGRLVVLAYHKVLPSDLSPKSDGMQAVNFESQVRVLRELFALAGPDDAMRALAPVSSRDRYPMLLTFDDGYENNRCYAAPVLHRHGVQGIIFLPTALIGTDAFIWTDEVRELVLASPRDALTFALEGTEEVLALHDRAARVRAVSRLKKVFKRLSPHALAVRLSELAMRADVVRVAQHGGTQLLDWNAVRELRALGVSVGSHSSRHFILSKLTDEELRADFTESQESLVRELGAPVRFLAYPNGHIEDIDDRVVAAARAAGFEYAFTMERAVASEGDDPMRLPRYAPADEPGSVVAFDLLRLLVRQVVRERFSRRPTAGTTQTPALSPPSRLRVA